MTIIQSISVILGFGIFVGAAPAAQAQTRTTSVQQERIWPEAITRLCPDHIGGDREFKGHGPEVRAWARLSIRRDRELWVTLYLHAKETKRDWTEAEGQWDRLLWTAPHGQRIMTILSDDYSEANYTDTDHALDRPAVRGGSLVRTFEIMGDTGGKDVGNCTADDVYLNVYFNEIRVRVTGDR